MKEIRFLCGPLSPFDREFEKEVLDEREEE